MEIDLDKWVLEAQPDYASARKSTHVILQAISSDETLRASMIIKGGTLLGIRYGSNRFTTDIDFSTEKKLSEVNLEEFKSSFNDALDVAESELNYGIKCRVQSYIIKPNPKGTFPTIKLKLAYCMRSDVAKLKRLEANNGSDTITIDYSFNEKSYNIELLELGDHNGTIQAYDICDLFAEKIRSVLQQSVRKRNREQDIYDIHYLLTTVAPLSEVEKEKVLASLLSKSAGKNIDYLLNSGGINDPEIIARSKEGYPALKDTVIDLPEFDVAYTSVSSFFKSLPW